MDGGVVGFFSLEMSAEQLATRIVAEQSGVPSYRIRRGDISEPDFYKITDVAREMQTIPFYIDQTGGLTISQLTARARRLKKRSNRGDEVERLPAAPSVIGENASRHPEQPREVHRVKSHVEADGEQPEMPKSEPPVE